MHHRVPRKAPCHNSQRAQSPNRAATRINTFGWSCQHFKPGQAQLIGWKSFLGQLGWPRHATNLGTATMGGSPVWHVRATVFGGPPECGAWSPGAEADLYVAQSDNTMMALHETGQTARGRSIRLLLLLALCLGVGVGPTRAGMAETTLRDRTVQAGTVAGYPVAWGDNSYSDYVAQGYWFTYLVNYIKTNNLNWCYWCLNGTQSLAPGRDPSTADWYGVLDPTWSTAASQPMMIKLQSIQ